jgi:hypothetical protein
MMTPGDRQFTPGTEGQSVHCSFCNKGPETVGELIEGPAWPGCTPAYICDDCVKLCMYMAEQRRMLGGAEKEPDQGEINAATQKMLEEKTLQALSTLTSLESEVIKRRYGLSGGFTFTLAEVAGQLGITPERVRELEREGVEKLRKGARVT